MRILPDRANVAIRLVLSAGAESAIDARKKMPAA
jgi:hypothetical protein